MFRIIDRIEIVGLEKKSEKNGYYVEVEFNLHERGFVTREIGPFTNDEMDNLKDLIEIIHKCMDTVPEDYEFIDGFNDWFGGNSSLEQSTYMEYLTKGYGNMAPFNSVKVYFYRDGEQYPCNIVWKK